MNGGAPSRTKAKRRLPNLILLQPIALDAVDDLDTLVAIASETDLAQTKTWPEAHFAPLTVAAEN